MMTGARRAVALFGLLALGTCGGDDPAPCCPDGVDARCLWNATTQRYDLDCRYACRTAGGDGGVSDGGNRGRNTISLPYDQPPPMCRD